ncbi:hypothetical protein HJC23_001209 [Cyclotella cryptica]|uniref:Site-specific DNA-methyltransferase (adenine-specific) n=1 Tax=Cyclotella cryptica TaxID=29204 RepID=A0ABD3QN29_9STRA|eukprot:CCRYP_003878-RA/>CCRYP_003878-RA protein AED:0.01 eAED:0.01 QI:202/-1/1/1/-1/1/1/487/388
MSGKPARRHDASDVRTPTCSPSTEARCTDPSEKLPSNSKKKRKRSASKRRRSGAVSTSSDHAITATAQKQNIASKSQHVGASKYPYPTDYNDHFETPLRAYSDILPLMQNVMNERLRCHQSDTKSSRSTEFTIYDPYFCTGRAATMLGKIFGECKTQSTKVHIQHEKRDFYKDIRQNKIPQHDILVTNPPYSGNHKERCLEFAVKQLKSHDRPFFLLMPNYVASKEYFRKVVLEESVQTVFVAPSSSQPYEYDHPEGTGYDTPPFQSVWFCGFSHGGTDRKMSMGTLRDHFVKSHSSDSCGKDNGTPRIAFSVEELIRMGCISGEKRKNPRQRKKIRQQAMQRASQAMGSSFGAHRSPNHGASSGGKKQEDQSSQNQAKKRLKTQKAH